MLSDAKFQAHSRTKVDTLCDKKLEMNLGTLSNSIDSVCETYHAKLLLSYFYLDDSRIRHVFSLLPLLEIVNLIKKLSTRCVPSKYTTVSFQDPVMKA